MSNLVAIGLQWGDEGKGKIVDFLADKADVIVRFQGGHNAGHTLVHGGRVHKLSLLPSGIIRSGKSCVIGNGVVLNPQVLLEEVQSLVNSGIEIGPDRLAIAENAVLLLPLHAEVDRMREERAGKSKIGTTGRGIGPAYEDKAGRRAIRVADLYRKKSIEERVERLLDFHNALRRGYGESPVEPAEVLDFLDRVRPGILPFARPVWKLLTTAHSEGKNVLFEGAQGVFLDIDHGTYPFVTSSSTVSSSAASGSGVSGQIASPVLGICKAYTTRVGAGPFPTELHDQVGEHLASVGHERGTVTGRPRRCGWLDAVMTFQACKLTGASAIALTKIDVLDGLPTLKICVGYHLGGKSIDYLPSLVSQQEELQPIYRTLPGWKESTAGVRCKADLPANARGYIREIERLLGVPVKLISTSPERLDTIVVDNFYGVS